MTEIVKDQVTDDAVEVENSQETTEEAFKQSVAQLLSTFKDLVEGATWMCVNGNGNDEPFCIVVAVGEKAGELHNTIIERFSDEGRD